MLMSAIKMGLSKTKASFYLRDVDSAKANKRIYDEVKDGHKEKNQQSVQHLDNREGKTLNKRLTETHKIIKVYT